MTMTQRTCLIAVIALAVLVPAPSRAQSTDDPDSILRLEPAKPEKAAPQGKRKVRRGSSNPVYPAALPPPLHYVPPRSQEVVTPSPVTPPPIVVPQTGQVLPNLPAVGAGPGGRETGQDRAIRCTHQAGIYGPAAGDRGAYIGGCINQ